MFIKLQDGRLLNASYIETAKVSVLDNTIARILLTNGQSIEEKYSSSSEAQGRVDSVIKQLTQTIADAIDEGTMGLIQSVEFDNERFILTFTTHGGTKTEIDFPVESTVKDGMYDATTECLVLVLVSGQSVSIPVSSLVPAIIGDKTLDDLETEDKSSVIGAINELNNKIGDIGLVLDEINGEVV